MFFVATVVVILLFFIMTGMIVGMLVSGGEASRVSSRVARLTQLPEDLAREIKTAEQLGTGERASLFSKVDLRPIIGRFTGENYFEALERDLAQADIKLRPSEFLIFRGAVVVFVACLALVVTRSLLLGILIAIPFLFLHAPLINFLKKRRINRFSLQLAEFLILVVNSLRAGQTFMQGCSIAAKESPDPIASEFRQVIKEVNLGLQEPEALENLLTRVPSEDLKIVVSGYTIQRKVGGNLAEILETTAGTIRERVRIQGQIDTLTTQGKLSGLLVGALPFFIGFAISGINPEYFQPMLTPPWGWATIGLALTMQLLGALMIKKIVTIEI
ncbi:MAG: type II secretion system F family protein [Verrucomicrobiia bacterium]